MHYIPSRSKFVLKRMTEKENDKSVDDNGEGKRVHSGSKDLREGKRKR